MWRISYVLHGLAGHMDFHCEADADTFMHEGYETDMFIMPEKTEVK